MTWRRFCNLVAGLSVDSRWACELRADKDKPAELDGAAAEAYFRSIT